jgi:hypothetical protein
VGVTLRDQVTSFAAGVDLGDSMGEKTDTHGEQDDVADGNTLD